MDITRLPVLQLLMGFFLIVLAIGFYGAFKAVEDDEADGEPAASETPPGTPGPGGNEIAVIMDDNFFDPDAITVAAGQPITFNLTNEGSAIHNMAIAGPDNDFGTDDDTVSDPDIVPGGQDAVLNWDSPPAPAEVDFRCEFHPDVMTGTITVQ